MYIRHWMGLMLISDQLLHRPWGQMRHEDMKTNHQSELLSPPAGLSAHYSQTSDPKTLKRVLERGRVSGPRAVRVLSRAVQTRSSVSSQVWLKKFHGPSVGSRLLEPYEIRWWWNLLISVLWRHQSCIIPWSFHDNVKVKWGSETPKTVTSPRNTKVKMNKRIQHFKVK